jgi:DNA-binding MarR family transcriptional regulator
MDERLSNQVFHQFLDLLRNQRQYTHRIIDEQGIRPMPFSVLRFLLESGPTTVSQVQSYIHHSPSTTSTLISQLEMGGYVTRTRSQADNRVVIVDLTPAGRKIAENTPLGGLPLLRQRLSTLPEERLLEIESVLVEILQLMSGTNSE